MSRSTQNAVLLLVGLSTLVMVIKGSYLNYVKPSLLPWLIAAAVVLIGLAVAAIVRDVRAGEGHDGHRHNPWLVWLLLVPIAMTAFVVPPPLGASDATPDVVPSAQPNARPRAFPPLPAGRAPTVSIPEILTRARNDSSNSLDRRLITTTGFTLKYSDGTYLSRVIIICCAADARLARIHLSGPAVAEAEGYPEDTWLEVQGMVLPETATAATNYIPTINVSSVKRIEKPANTYTY
jgi:uncharacterized repeat protein (TIGR03943 family)